MFNIYDIFTLLNVFNKSLTERYTMTNKEKIQQTKNKLLNSTIKLMEQSDNPLSVTSREIAREAGCNLAMINYCFGSREDLIYCVFQKLYDEYHKSQMIHALQDENLTPKDFLKRSYYQGAKFMMENYNFAQTLGGFILLKRDLGEEFFSYKYVYAHYQGKKSEDDCKLIAYELSAMMNLIIYRKEDVKAAFGIDIDNDNDLRRLIDMRVDLLLGDINKYDGIVE